jgi:hypothetical protein
MKPAINLVILFLVCVSVNLGVALYLLDAKDKKLSAVKMTPVSSPQVAGAIAAALENMNRQNVYRDTVILKNILRTQHHLKMHGQRIPMCPDCERSTARQNYANKDSL